jgi:hypothetical protein
MHACLLFATLVLVFGCSQRLATAASTRSSAGPQDTFDCVKRQLTDLGYKQSSIDVDEHRISAVKIDMNSRRPDTQFRRLLDRLDVEVAAEADGQTSIAATGRTFAEYTTQRGPTEVEEQPSKEVKAATEQLLQKCRS